MTIPEFLEQQAAERQPLMNAIHEAIMANDKTVQPVIEPMMGKEMIIYKEQGKVMKYGLASVKNYMSIHCLPMYMNPPLFNKFVASMPNAKFQKGCVNFVDASEMPIAAVAQLVIDCSGISILALLEARNKKKK